MLYQLYCQRTKLGKLQAIIGINVSIFCFLLPDDQWISIFSPVGKIGWSLKLHFHSLPGASCTVRGVELSNNVMNQFPGPDSSTTQCIVSYQHLQYLH